MNKKVTSFVISTLLSATSIATAGSADDVADVIIGIAVSKGIETTLGAASVNPISVLLVSVAPSDIGTCPAIEDPSSKAFQQILLLRKQHNFSEDEIDNVITAIPGC